MENKTSNTRKARHFLYALLCTFISVWVYGQRETDTVNVVMLMCDTAKPYYVNTYCTFDSLTCEGWVGHVEYDTTYYGYSQVVCWQFGLEILEKHNTSEGKIDPGCTICVDERGKIVDCYYDYWVHVKYLDTDKNEISKDYIIWQSVRRE